jgi:hypothetical protein
MPIRALVELAPILLAVLLAWLLPSLPNRVWALPSALLRRFARNGKQAVVSSAVLTFIACAVTCAVWNPVPRTHDEFAYLLASDTFAHGRLANPTHPLWEHFESFQIFHTPSYQAKYPPGQGLFMAAGQVLTGWPIVGVWLSMTAGAAALCWMLLAWMPPRWALFGALLPALRFGTIPLWDSDLFAYWTTNYRGGAVAMAGGALLLGALPRLLRRARARDAAAMAVGLLVMANSRPYEGFVIAVPAAVLLGGWLLLRRPPWGFVARCVVLPAAGVLALGGLWMGYYNYRVTGEALKLPYLTYSEQYDVIPMFTFQPLRPPKIYRHDAMRRLYLENTVRLYQWKTEGTGRFLGFERADFTRIIDYFLGVALGAPLLWLLARPWDLWMIYCAGLIILAVLASSISVQTDILKPHYLAPVAPCFVLLALTALRRARTARIAGRRVGRAMVDTIVALCLFSVVLGSVPRKMRGAPYEDLPLTQYRPRILEELEATEQKDLVIVTYAPDHNIHEEWVYNGASLDDAPVVWARDMGPEKNGRLLEHYADRKIWRLYADDAPPRMKAYETTAE